MVLRHTRAFVAIASVLTGAGCGGPTTPTPAPAPQPSGVPAPTPSSRVLTSIAGAVEDTAYVRLAGAKVEMLDGPQAGASTLTDAEGVFRFSGHFTSDITLRASFEGFASSAKTLILANGTGSEGLIGFTLQPNQPGLQLSLGLYDLTISADGSCTDVPEDLRTVTFTVIIGANQNPASNSSYVVNVLGTFPDSMDIALGVAGDRLGFELDDLVPVKAIPPSTYIEIAGTAGMIPATVTQSTIVIPFYGLYDYCVLKTPMPSNQWTTCHILPASTIVTHVECFANHQMIFKKRF
jgi:hypothetical protein